MLALNGVVSNSGTVTANDLTISGCLRQQAPCPMVLTLKSELLLPQDCAEVNADGTISETSVNAIRYRAGVKTTT